MKRTVIFLIAALALALTLTACSAAPADTPADTPVSQETAAPAAQESQREPAWALDPAAVTDDFAADTLIRLPELALSGPGFTFDSPDELTSQQLYLLFQAWTEPAEADACYDAAAGVYVFPADTIRRTLDRYLTGFRFDPAGCLLYDAGRDAIVTPMAGGFGGNIDVQIESRTFDGSTAVLTALLDGSVRKTYTITFYDGGYRYESVRQLEQD